MWLSLNVTDTDGRLFVHHQLNVTTVAVDAVVRDVGYGLQFIGQLLSDSAGLYKEVNLTIVKLFVDTGSFEYSVFLCLVAVE